MRASRSIGSAMAHAQSDPSASESPDSPLAVANEIVRRWSAGESSDDLVAVERQSSDASPPFAWLPDPGAREHPEERRRTAEAMGMRMRARSVTEGPGGWVLIEAIWSLDGNVAGGTAGMIWFAVRVADGKVAEIHAHQDREAAEERTGATVPVAEDSGTV